MAMIKCPECGAEISNKASSCPHCGISFEKQKFCKFCGALIDKDCIVCPKCGKQVENLKESADRNIIINNNTSSSSSSSSNASAAAVGGIPYTQGISPKSWIATLLLCLFFGIIGIHRFYVGKIGTGILMILLCMTGISEIWCVIDFICILIGRFKDKQGLVVKR